MLVRQNAKPPGVLTSIGYRVGHVVTPLLRQSLTESPCRPLPSAPQTPLCLLFVPHSKLLTFNSLSTLNSQLILHSYSYSYSRPSRQTQYILTRLLLLILLLLFTLLCTFCFLNLFCAHKFYLTSSTLTYYIFSYLYTYFFFSLIMQNRSVNSDTNFKI